MVAPQHRRAGPFRSRTGGRHGLTGIGPRQGTGDTGGHISTEPRINERIRVPEVRLVGPSGEQVGIVSITDALRLAQESDLDLVEVAPTARPPVCKLMDYGKFKYESALKARESRKNQAQTVIKEIKIRPKIDPHDYGTKRGHVERFLRQGDKVKVTIMFRGREQSRPELGYKLLQRLAVDVEELGLVESAPKQDGRNMIMVIGPHKKKADTKVARGPERASARAAAPMGAASHDLLTADLLAVSEAADHVSLGQGTGQGPAEQSPAAHSSFSQGPASQGTGHAPVAQGTVAQGTAAQGTAGQGTAGQGSAQGTAGQGTARAGSARQDPARQGSAGRSATDSPSTDVQARLRPAPRPAAATPNAPAAANPESARPTAPAANSESAMPSAPATTPDSATPVR